MRIVLVNLSGRGDKDMGILARELELGGAPAENVGESAPKESL